MEEKENLEAYYEIFETIHDATRRLIDLIDKRARVSFWTKRIGKSRLRRKRWAGMRVHLGHPYAVDFRSPFRRESGGRIDASCRERISQLKRRLANPLVTIGFDH